MVERIIAIYVQLLDSELLTTHESSDRESAFLMAAYDIAVKEQELSVQQAALSMTAPKP